MITEETWEQFIKYSSNPDGRIHAVRDGYVDLWPGDSVITLDGEFTSEGLRKLADWMDAHKKE